MTLAEEKLKTPNKSSTSPMAGSCDYSCFSQGYNAENVTNVMQLVLHNNSDTDTTTATDSMSTWSGIRHPYWSNFPSPPHEIHVTIGFAMATIGVLAVSGNIFVIFVFLRFRSLRTPGNLLMINLAVSDLLMALTGFPLYAVASFYGRWIYPDAVCLLYGACGATFGLLSINSLAAIAVDRYLVIAHSYSVSNRTNKRQAVVMIIISWINSLFWAIPPLLGWNRYMLEGFGTTCTFDYLSRRRSDKYFVMSMFVCGFCVPLSLIIGSYAYIYGVVHRHERMFRTMSQNLNARIMQGAKEATQKTEMKTARTVILAVLCYCVSWVPYATIALIGIYGRYQLLTPLVTAVPGILAKMSTIYNPFLYTFSHPRFRKKVMLLIFKKNLDRNTSHYDQTYVTKSRTQQHRLARMNCSESMQIPVTTVSSTSSWSDDTPPPGPRSAFHLQDASEHTETASLASSAKSSNHASALSTKSCSAQLPNKSFKILSKDGQKGHKVKKVEDNEETSSFLESKGKRAKNSLTNVTLQPPIETVV